MQRSTPEGAGDQTGSSAMSHWTGLIVGVVAILSLLGVAAALPPWVSFFVCATSVLLFPGGVGAGLTGVAHKRRSLAEQLVTSFVIGAGFICALGLVGHLLRLRLGDLVWIIIVAYAAGASAMMARHHFRRSPEETSSAGEPIRRSWGIHTAVLALAAGAALVTLMTARDYDDWFYLAYIKDYVVGKPLGGGDAIFGAGLEAPIRIWFGAGWWTLEALLSKVSGIDPIAVHQTFMPLLVVPLAVLALFALSHELFRSLRIALLACCLQVLFYISSAFPYKSAGWFLFCRIAQDKAASLFVVVPVAAMLALRLIRPAADRDTAERNHTYGLYSFAVVTSILVHGMGPLWSCLFIIPFALSEYLRRDRRVQARTLLAVLLPLLVCGLILVASRGAIRGFIRAPEPAPVPASEMIVRPYLPGDPLRPVTETHNSLAWILADRFVILNPLFVTRYPLALVGLALTLVLLARMRRSTSARFLLGVTLSSLALLYTPAGIALLSCFMTRRLVFRLSLVFPWGLIIARCLASIRMRQVWVWLVVVGIALGLARGNPLSYTDSLHRMRSRNRPSPDAWAAFGFLGSQPSPQGVIFASEGVGRMIPAFLPDAAPVNFREFGPVDGEDLAALVSREEVSLELLGVLKANQVGYMLLENTEPLARALARREPGFTLVHRNASYSVWQVQPPFR
jgi:hypothetical protein